MLDSPIHGPGHPEQKKLERIFPAIQIFVPEHPGSAAYLTPREVHPDSRKFTWRNVVREAHTGLIHSTYTTGYNSCVE